MSRSDGFEITIKSDDRVELNKAIDAASEHWPFEDWIACVKGEATSYAENNLTGGISASKCIDKIAMTVWRAVKKFIQIKVTVSHIESTPSELFIRDKDDYQLLMIQNNPIHEAEGKWWFWDETWTYRQGPFDTEEETKKELGY